MQGFEQSPLELQTYNSLQDEHLVEYYSSPQRRRHLRRMGLITKDGMLVDELTFQRKALEKEQRKRYKDMMATTTATRVSKEQQQQKAELKKKLETLAKYETVRRIKMERLHPPGVQMYHQQKGHSAPGQGSIGLGQRSPDLGQISLGSDTATHLQLSKVLETHKDRVKFSPEELRELKQLVETITGEKMTSPSILCNTVRPYTPISPKPRKPMDFRVESGHRRPRTASSRTHKFSSRKMALPREVVKDRLEDAVKVKLRYLGTKRPLKKGRKCTEAQAKDPPTEVIVEQQARGYRPLPVYNGQVRPGDTVLFQSIRCVGMPFALVIYTNGMIDCRVSTCCEYRHRPGTVLGDRRSARFKVVDIKGGSPCFQCTAREEKSEKHQLFSRTLQLTTTLQPSQLESSNSLEQGGGEKGRREEEDLSPSPASSVYSASFQSESSHSSGDGENGDDEPAKKGSTGSLCGLSEHPDNGDGSQSNFSKNTDDPQSVKEERIQERNSEDWPSLVTRGGVTIVYQLGPISTSEAATQTVKEQLTAITQTTATHDGDSACPLAEDDTMAKRDNLEEGDETATMEAENVGAAAVGEGKERVEPKLALWGDNEARTDEQKGEINSQTVTDIKDEVQVQPSLQDNTDSSEPPLTDAQTEDLQPDEESELEQAKPSTAAPHIGENLSSSDNSPEHQPPQTEQISDGEVESLSSTSSLTHVSERQLSSSAASASLSATESQTRLTAAGAVPDENNAGNGNGPEPTPHDSQDTLKTESRANLTGEHNTVVCEEEFTKAWT